MPVADQLGIDLGAARAGVLELLEHHDAGALAHHEAVAILVIGARGPRRLVVEAGRQRAAGREARDRDPVDRRFRAAGDHHVGVVERDQPRRVADRMRAGRAGRDDRVVGALEAVRDRHVAGREIDQAARDEERRHPARPLLLEDDRGLGDALEAADARADHHAGGDLLLFGLGLAAGILDRLRGSAHGVGDELVDLALLLGLHPLVGIVGAVVAVAARNEAGDLAGQVGDLELLDAARAALAGEEARPRRLDTAAERRDHSQSGDDDTSHLMPARGCSG